MSFLPIGYKTKWRLKMDVKEKLESVVKHFDDELNFVSGGKKLAPRSLADKLVVDVFLEILRSKNLCAFLDEGFSHSSEGMCGDEDEKSYNASIFRKGDTKTYIVLKLRSGRHYIDYETKEPAYLAELTWYHKEVYLGPSILSGLEIESSEVLKSELVRIGKAIFGL